jgi:hypothetical protein
VGGARARGEARGGWAEDARQGGRWAARKHTAKRAGEQAPGRTASGCGQAEKAHSERAEGVR